MDRAATRGGAVRPPIAEAGPGQQLAGYAFELLAWAEKEGLVWDADGNNWGSRLEVYKSDPEEVPMDQWETDLVRSVVDEHIDRFIDRPTKRADLVREITFPFPVVVIARLAEVSWTWVALGAAGLHFVLAVIAVVIAWLRVKKLPYRELTKELKKDREWLKLD